MLKKSLFSTKFSFPLLFIVMVLYQSFTPTLTASVTYSPVFYPQVSQKELERREEAFRKDMEDLHHFLSPTPKEAQKRLTHALQTNVDLLKWASYISGSLFIASIGLWYYGCWLQNRYKPWSLYPDENDNDVQRFSKSLGFTSAIIFFGTVFAQAWRIGKLKEFSLKT